MYHWCQFHHLFPCFLAELDELELCKYVFLADPFDADLELVTGTALLTGFDFLRLPLSCDRVTLDDGCPAEIGVLEWVGVLTVTCLEVFSPDGM